MLRPVAAIDDHGKPAASPMPATEDPGWTVIAPRPHVPMKTPEEFKAYFETQLHPVLEELEQSRRKISRNLLLILGALAAFVAVLFFAALSLGAIPNLLIVLLLVAAGIGAWVSHSLTKDFRFQFKRQIIGPLVRFGDPSLTYEPDQCIPQIRFEDSRLFLHPIDRYRGEDCVAGKIGATAIEFSEVHAEYKTTTTDGRGHRRTQWHTIFKGLFFIADFNKAFGGVTVVLPDVAQRFMGFLGQKLQEMNLGRREKLVKLEDPEFEKLFVVYGDDQIEARYLLSTSLMRRILEFRNRTGRDVSLAFVQSSVHVALSMNKNLFEPRLFRTVVDFDLMNEYLQDLRLAIGIVDDLNLNTRIWSKT